MIFFQIIGVSIKLSSYGSGGAVTLILNVNGSLSDLITFFFVKIFRERLKEMLLYIQYNMDKLSKSELFQIISQQSKNIAALTKQVKQLIDVNKQLIERNKPVPAPRTEKIMEQPIPAPRKNVKKMIKEYEENIKPIPPPRTKIKQVNKALKGYTESYEVTVIDDKDPLVQLQKNKTKTRILYQKHIRIHERFEVY